MTRAILQDDDSQQYWSLVQRLERLEKSISRAPSYTTATKPTAAAAGVGALIFVSDATDGQRFQGSDGANWKILG